LELRDTFIAARQQQEWFNVSTLSYNNNNIALDPHESFLDLFRPIVCQRGVYLHSNIKSPIDNSLFTTENLKVTT